MNLSLAPGKLRFAKNALSNVINGVSSAVFALVLPYFFVRYFSRPEFGLWVLVLQLAAYVNYLNFGFQVAVGRFVAFSLERNDRLHAQRIVAASLQTLSLLGAVGVGLIVVLDWIFPAVFRQVDPKLIPEARAALLWIGTATAVGLPFSTFMGVFIGQQRNEIPAAISATGRLLLAVAVIIAAARTRDLVIVAEVYFAGSIAQYLLQYIVFLHFFRDWEISVFEWHRPVARELISYCLGLSVWNFAMLLVNGLDTTIVGIFDFRSVAPYGVALSIVTFFAGLLQALASPLIQTFARRHAREEHAEMLRDLEVASFICAVLLFVGGGWLVCEAGWVFEAWVGKSLAQTAIPIFVVLMIANALRYTSSPYVYYVVSTGQQQKIILTPILEGLINFAASVALVVKFGAIGVAIATLIGVIFAISANYSYNMKRTLPGGYSSAHFARFAIVEPLAYCSPVILVAIFQWAFHMAILPATTLVAAASVPAAYRVWRLIVTSDPAKFA